MRFTVTIKKGFYNAGPMVTGTQGWREVSIEFDMPEGCRAAVVRLRRRPVVASIRRSEVGCGWMTSDWKRLGNDPKRISSRNESHAI